MHASLVRLYTELERKKKLGRRVPSNKKFDKRAKNERSLRKHFPDNVPTAVSNTLSVIISVNFLTYASNTYCGAPSTINNSWHVDTPRIYLQGLLVDLHPRFDDKFRTMVGTSLEWYLVWADEIKIERKMYAFTNLSKSVLRLDLRKLNNLCGKIFRSFSFVMLVWNNLT